MDFIGFFPLYLSYTFMHYYLKAMYNMRTLQTFGYLLVRSFYAKRLILHLFKLYQMRQNLFTLKKNL